MQHVAIMRKSWGLLPKILQGDKKIESRRYKAKFPPWNRIRAGDIIYFKDAGAPITVKVDVEKVLQFENYDDGRLNEIIKKYGGEGGICFPSPSDETFEWARKRKYCVLMFLRNPQKIPPIEIDKKGFGNACAWICVEDINKIKLKH